MQFERGIWRESVRNFWANKWVVLTVVALFAGFSIFQDVTKMKSGSAWVEFAWVPLAIAAHSTILKGTSGFAVGVGGDYKSVFWPFLGRSLGLSFIGIIPATLIAIPFAGKDETLMIYVLLVCYGAFASFILAKWGTMLPACVAEGDKTFRAAGARGSKTFTYVLGRFWGCNALLLAGGFAVLIGTFTAVKVTLDLTAGIKLGFVADEVLQAGFTLIFAFNLVMLATILSRAYLVAEEKTAPASSGAA